MRSVIFTLSLFIPLAVSAAEGSVSLENNQGVWWFRAPSGERFLSFGVNHIEAVYWQSPRNATFVRESYGGQMFMHNGDFDEQALAVKKWAKRVAENLKEWGFNTLGFHNPLSNTLQTSVGGWYVCQLPINVSWGWNMKRSALIAAFEKRPMDIFDRSFQLELDEVTNRLVRPRVEDSQLLGYAYTDGPPWTVEDDVEIAAHSKLTSSQKIIHPWVHALMSLPASAAGKKEWIANLKRRYSTPAQAASVYALQAYSWEELAAITDWQAVVNVKAALEDGTAFLEIIMRQWYHERRRSIRRVDDKHLILGDKLNMNRDRRYPGPMADSLRCMRDFVDVINVQYYGPADEQVETLKEVHEITGLPIMNGDTTCLPLWPDESLIKGEAFYSSLARTYDETLTKLFAQPWFIGWHHCGYMRGLRRPYLSALKNGRKMEAASYENRGVTYREGFVDDHERTINQIVTPLKASILKCPGLHKASKAIAAP